MTVPVLDQELIVLGTIFNSQYTFASVAKVLRASFFETKAYGIIYLTLHRGRTRYSKLLSAEELWAELVTQFDMNSRIDLREAYIAVVGYKTGAGTGIDPSFAISQIEQFVRKRLMQATISGVVQQTISNQDIKWDQVMSELKSLNFMVSQRPPVGMLDLDSIKAEAMTATAGNVMESGIPGLNQAFSYRGYNKKALYQFVAAPGVGKSTCLVAEAANFAIQGHNVAYVVLGDLTLYDIWVRLLSRLFCDAAHSQNLLIRMPWAQIEADIAAYNVDGRFSRIQILAYPAASLTAAGLREEVFKIKEERFNGKLDAVIVDYADNLVSEHESMYVSGGEIYTQLNKMVWDFNLVGLTASQPKATYWDEEILKDQNAAAESGKKHHIVDASFNIGKPVRLIDDSAVACVHLAKMRRGKAHINLFIRIFYDNCRIEEITMQDYLTLKKDYARGKADTTGNQAQTMQIPAVLPVGV